MSTYLTLLLFLLGWAGAFCSGSLACTLAFGLGFGFAASFALGRGFLGITVLILTVHKLYLIDLATKHRMGRTFLGITVFICNGHKIR